ncbi:MAG: hypothetical protein ABW098_19230 [Candidatus Thiodiazotropha sp.]
MSNQAGVTLRMPPGLFSLLISSILDDNDNKHDDFRRQANNPILHTVNKRIK